METSRNGESVPVEESSQVYQKSGRSRWSRADRANSRQTGKRVPKPGWLAGESDKADCSGTGRVRNGQTSRMKGM